jgi:hypothetical protein
MIVEYDRSRVAGVQSLMTVGDSTPSPTLLRYALWAGIAVVVWKLMR